MADPPIEHYGKEHTATGFIAAGVTAGGIILIVLALVYCWRRQKPPTNHNNNIESAAYNDWSSIYEDNTRRSLPSDHRRTALPPPAFATFPQRPVLATARSSRTAVENPFLDPDEFDSGRDLFPQPQALQLLQATRRE